MAKTLLPGEAYFVASCPLESLSCPKFLDVLAPYEAHVEPILCSVILLTPGAG